MQVVPWNQQWNHYCKWTLILQPQRKYNAAFLERRKARAAERSSLTTFNFGA
jgi:hypothetical protein